MRRNVLFPLLILLSASAGLWASDNPLIGTWKLNLAKSRFSPGFPVPKSRTVKYEASGPNGMKYTNDSVLADGRPLHAEYTVQFDGKEYPVAGDPSRDSTSQRWIDGRTTEMINRKDGKVVETTRRVLSKDGKTLTVTAKGIRNGKPYSNLHVYEKQ
jgi:hypothetical protein